MKEKIHPQYYPKAKITCACGKVFSIGATKKAMEVETCSACHPFYIGDKAVVRGGRVERFKARMEKHDILQKEIKTRVKKPRTRVPRQARDTVQGMPKIKKSSKTNKESK